MLRDRYMTQSAPKAGVLGGPLGIPLQFGDHENVTQSHKFFSTFIRKELPSDLQHNFLLSTRVG